MKQPLVALLLVSLAGNAALAFVALRQPKSGAAATNSAPPLAAAAVVPGAATHSSATTEASPTAAPATWSAYQKGHDLNGLVANLRAAGFPPSVIRVTVRQMIADQQDRSALDRMPFWKQNFQNPEYQAAQAELNNRTREQYEALLGKDALPSASLDAASRARRYGNLTDDKIDKIELMNREFSELSSQMYAQRRSADFQGTMAAQTAMQEERQKELASILSPAELEQYELRTSSASSRVASGLKSIDVTEQEFTELFRAQKAFEAVDPSRTGTMDADSMAKRNEAQDVLNERARGVLGEDRFYEYLKSSDSNYARAVTAMSSFTSVTPAQIYELARMEREYQGAAAAMARTAQANNGQGNNQDRAAAMAAFTAMRQEFQNKANALVGEAAAKAYQDRNRTSRSGAATGTTTTTTVVRPGGP